MAHQLKLQIEDVFQDTRYIRVVDWSVYDKRLEIKNRVVKVEIPGQDNFKLIKLPTNESFAYTSKSLKISTQLEDLPDGLWKFTISVCPNEKVFSIQYHFRSAALEARLMAYVCKSISSCVEPEVSALLLECILKMKALKANSIDAYNVQKAYDLYTEIETAISSLLIK
jgi:hypothetical protein